MRSRQGYLSSSLQFRRTLVTWSSSSASSSLALVSQSKFITPELFPTKPTPEDGATGESITKKAAKPLPQFSQAVKYGDLVYCSGNIGLNPDTSMIVEGGVKEQTVSQPNVVETGSSTNVETVAHLKFRLQRQALRNLSEILAEAGSSINNLVKMNIILTTMDHFGLMNEFVKTELKPLSISIYLVPKDLGQVDLISITSVVHASQSINYISTPW